MANCQNCKQQLDYWTVYRSFLSGYDPFTCPNCGVAYTHQPVNRFIGAGMVLFTIVLLFILDQVFEPALAIGWQLLIGLVIAGVLSLAMVPLLRFEVQKQPDSER